MNRMNRMDLNRVVNRVVGTKESKFGKIEGDLLKLNGKYFKITEVTYDTLIINTNTLMGKYGDEFPLDMVR